jgi:hypothetical protein
MKAVLAASCLLLAVLPMCKPDATKSTSADTAAVVNPASPAEVRAQFDILRDSADANWQRMMTSDDQKLADMRGLVQDLKQQRGLDAAQLRLLNQATARLKAQRYDRQSMASSALIDGYDAAQDSVLHTLTPLAAPDGNAPTARIRDWQRGELPRPLRCRCQSLQQLPESAPSRASQNGQQIRQPAAAAVV